MKWTATHPLVRKLDAMRKAGELLQDIVLAPLTREDLEQLIADSLRCTREHARPLAELVHEKTTGNPFFAIQFLSALFEEGLLDLRSCRQAMVLGPEIAFAPKGIPTMSWTSWSASSPAWSLTPRTP